MATTTTYTINIAHRGNHNLEEMVASLPERFETIGTTIYRGANGRNHIKVVEVEGEKDSEKMRVVVKQYHRPNSVQRIDQTYFSGNKAARAYYNGCRMMERGFKTPEPIAYVEQRHNGIYQRGWYVCGYDEGEALAGLMYEQRSVVEDFARYVADMHRAGIVHHDLNPSNVRCHKEVGEKHYWFSLIDINRMEILKYGRVPTRRQRIKELIIFPHHDMSLFEMYIDTYLSACGCEDKDVRQRIMRKKERRVGRRHPMKKFFKHFSGLYYAVLNRK